MGQSAQQGARLRPATCPRMASGRSARSRHQRSCSLLALEPQSCPSCLFSPWVAPCVVGGFPPNLPPFSNPSCCLPPVPSGHLTAVNLRADFGYIQVMRRVEPCKGRAPSIPLCGMRRSSSQVPKRSGFMPAAVLFGMPRCTRRRASCCR